MAQRRGQVVPLRSAGRKLALPLRVLVVSGPNLALLGSREPEIYGTTTLESIHLRLTQVARDHDTTLDTRQSNHEGDLVTWVGEAGVNNFHGVVLNPGAYTHTSIALLDAIKAAGLPVIEVHLSNPESRERFRRKSYVARACVGRVAGFGGQSYELGLLGLISHLRQAPLPPRSASVRPLPTAKRRSPLGPRKP